MNPLSQKFLCQFGGKLKSSLYTGLVSYWKLGEATGAARADSFGTNTLTNNNNVSQVTGVGGVGFASGFVAASSQYLTVASNDSLKTGNVNFSLAFWLNTTQATTAVMAGKSAGPSNGEWDMFLLAHNANLRTLDASTAVGNVSTSDVHDGNWHFVAAVQDIANNRVGISLDGGAFTYSTLTGTPIVNSIALTMGCSPSIALFYTGSLQALAFWNKRVLAAADVTKLYNGGAVFPFPW